LRAEAERLRNLGAPTASLLYLVLRRAALYSAIGIALGLTVSAISTRFLQSQLFETSPLDPLTFAGVTVLVIVCTVGASLIPAARAARLDPITALHYE
jgi:putative ABC transport system permease protein